MKNGLNLFRVIMVCSLFAFFSCTNDNESQKQTKDTLKTVVDSTAETKDNISYQIPSPEDLFVIVKKSKLPYKENLLSVTDANFVTTMAKELNLGIYIADLSYSSVFSMNQNTLKYFTSVYKITEGLGISSIVSNSFMDRMKNNLDKPDSLSLITSNSYYTIIQDLDNAGKGKTVSVVATGGWIEGMYIITNLIEKFDVANPAIQRLANQKAVFGNLYKNLEKYKSDKDVAEVQKDLEPLKVILDQMQSAKQESGVAKTKDGKIVLGSKNNVNFTETQFNEFKLKVKDIRTKFVKQ